LIANMAWKSWRIPRLALVTLAFSGAAFAWEAEAPYMATAHGHRFSLVTAQQNGCSVLVRLYFVAPDKAYAADSPARNYYRFASRVRFKEGKSIQTRIFANREPGSRVYAEIYDTAPEGCWAKTEQKFQGVDIEACRGHGCRPPPFQ
jgi:hypothetical protein